MEMDRHKIDICMISETKRKAKDNIRYRNHILFYSGVDKEKRAHAGVGILIHRKYENSIEGITYINENIMNVILKLNNGKIHFLSVYALDISKSREEREKFFDQLQSAIDQLPINEKVFIMGDFNARTRNNTVPGNMQKFNEEVINNNGELLITLCAQNELRINDTYFPHKMQYTFSNTREFHH